MELREATTRLYASRESSPSIRRPSRCEKRTASGWSSSTVRANRPCYASRRSGTRFSYSSSNIHHDDFHRSRSVPAREWIKQKATSEVETLLILLDVSLAAAGLYCALVAAGYWETVANVLHVAGPFTRSSSSASRARRRDALYARQTPKTPSTAALIVSGPSRSFWKVTRRFT
jgi:hypothetical protein